MERNQLHAFDVAVRVENRVADPLARARQDSRPKRHHLPALRRHDDFSLMWLTGACDSIASLALWENRDVRNYAVIIHEDPEGGFWGEVPALPGCYSQGETVDELEQNIREAIAGVLEVLREQGQEPDSRIQILDVAV